MGSVFKFVSSDVDDKSKLILIKWNSINQSKFYRKLKMSRITTRLKEWWEKKSLPVKSTTRISMLIILLAVELCSCFTERSKWFPHFLGSSRETNKMERWALLLMNRIILVRCLLIILGWALFIHRFHILKYIRKSIDVAVYTLPDSESFCKKISPELAGGELEEILIHIEELLEEIFSRIDFLYIKNKLENIP